MQPSSESRTTWVIPDLVRYPAPEAAYGVYSIIQGALNGHQQLMCSVARAHVYYLQLQPPTKLVHSGTKWVWPMTDSLFQLERPPTAESLFISQQRQELAAAWPSSQPCMAPQQAICNLGLFIFIKSSSLSNKLSAVQNNSYPKHLDQNGVHIG